MGSRLDEVLKESTQLIFLCSGNIIRSAFAHIYAETMNFRQEILSAGTKYWNNDILDRTGEKLLDLGVPVERIEGFKPTHYSELDYEKLDNPIFFGMKEEHLKALDKYDIPYKRRFLLTEIICKNTDVKDPYFEGGYEEVFALIKQCVETLFEKINPKV